jgi:hypothetical protein
VSEIVLGHYPFYLEEARRRGAACLNIPQWEWERMTEAERWERNQQFLDQAIERGDEIILATSLGALQIGSYFHKELKYLASRGYRLAKDRMRLVRWEE